MAPPLLGTAISSVYPNGEAVSFKFNSRAGKGDSLVAQIPNKCGCCGFCIVQQCLLACYEAEFSNADRRAATRSFEGSESPSVDGANKTKGDSAAGEASRCTPNAPSHGAASAETTDDECLDGDTPTPANPLLLSEAAGDVTTALVAKVTVSTPSPVSEGETSPLSAPVGSTPTPSSQNGGDLSMLLTFGDFDEAAQVLAFDDYTTEPPSPGTSAAEEVGEGDDEDEADNAAPPLSPSTVDWSNDFPRLWDMEYVADNPATAVESAESSPVPPTIVIGAVFDDGEAGAAGSTTPATPDWSNDSSRLCDTEQVVDHSTTAVESAESSPAPPTIDEGCRADDVQAGDAGPTTPATPGLAASFFFTLWGDMDPADSPVAATATSALPASTVDKPGRPATTYSRPSADIEASTPAPQQESCRQDTVTAPATAPPSGSETTRVNGAVVGTPTLSAAALPFTPAASTTEAASATGGTVATSCTRDGGQTNGVEGGVAEAVAATLPAGQVKQDAESRAELAGLTKSKLSATAKPFAPSTYTLEAASAAREVWKSHSVVILAKAKAKAAVDVRMELEAAVGSTPEERREARHNAAAATAAAEAPTRPQGVNQWSAADALVEETSLRKLSDTPSTSHGEELAAAQRYLENCSTAVEKFRQSDCIDHALHLGMDTLTLDGEVGDENAMRGRKAVHGSTQERLERALQTDKIDSLPVSCVSTTTKVDNAFSGWFGQLTLEEAATPQEEEARYLQQVTARTSVQDAFAALATEKELLLQEEERKNAAAAREKKTRALGMQHMQAVWQARADAQAACQARAKRAEEEAKAAAAQEKAAKAAAALEQQKKALEEKKRKAIADAEAQRQAQQAAREQKVEVRACLDAVRRRRSARIRAAALGKVTEAREDLRSLSFPCSGYLRELWRDGKIASRGRD